MNNKNIIIAGAIAIGIYLFSQGKVIFSAATQKAARKVDISKIPVQQLRYLIAHMPAQMKTGKVMAALKAEVARREAAWLAVHKVARKRIGQPTTQAARIAALRKAAVRKAAAQKIGKIIGKKVAQNMAQKIKARRAVMAWYAKRQGPQIQRPNLNKKQPTSKLFPGAERSRIIPYSESSRHSYYGSKTHKVLNPGYMEKRYKADQKQALEFRLNELRAMFPQSNL